MDRKSGSDTRFIEILKTRLGERLSTAAAVRDHHGRDESHHPSAPPDAVAFPESTEEIAEIVRVCAKHRQPIIPFGAGTALEGHVAAVRGGLCLDLSRMKKILKVNNDDLDCRVEAGVTHSQLNEHLRDTGLFFPVDPGADATIGGMTATSASGTNAVRYGTMRENVLGMTAVLADGRIVRTGGRARKSSSGYDLTRLFIGSEGTLGVITEVQVRLYGIPEAISAAVCSFSDFEGAVNTVIRTIQLGVPVARIELIDEVMMDAVNRYSKLSYPVQPTLFFEFHGSARGVQEQAETVCEIASENGGGDFRWATGHEERARLWRARHEALYAALALRPGALAWVTDVCVPISRLAECILDTRRDIQHNGLLAPIVGHAGDGNYHLAILINPEDEVEMARARSLNERMVQRALAVGGTCTGEHGVGIGKIHFMYAEHGEAVSAMRQIKQALDPDNIMNPGKLLPGS